MENKKKIGLVLSGGSAWGLSHIGVLKRLEEENIKPDLIVGSSIGALIGSLYCIGMPINYIEGIAENFNYTILIDFSKDRKMGLLEGKFVEEFIKILTKDKCFSDCKIPFYVNSTNFLTGEEIIIDKGKLYKAVRASTSIPWIFKPFKIGNRLLTDGGVYNPLPVYIAKKYGAEKIIAVGFKNETKSDLKDENIIVDNKTFLETPGEFFRKEILNNKILTKLFKRKNLETYESIIVNENENLLVIENFLNILFMGKIKNTEKETDIFLTPNVSKYMQLNFFKGKELIEEGYKEADKEIDEIIKLLKN